MIVVPTRMDTPVERAARRRAGLSLAGILLAVVAVVATLAALVAAHAATHPVTGPAGAPPVGRASATTGAPSTGPSSRSAGWDVAAERVLATRPMPALPVQAALPQPLTSQSAGPPIGLPAPTTSADRWIPGGFPATPPGAVAQLAALDQIAITGADPQVYAAAYRQQSLPGAPDPDSTGVVAALGSLRAHAGLPATGPAADLSATYQVTEGLIKGVTDAGRYTVVCVLGELAVDYQGQSATAGLGDCQALRWTGSDWRVSPGPVAAAAPNAWPGSAASVAAGYREVS